MLVAEKPSTQRWTLDEVSAFIDNLHSLIMHSTIINECSL